MGMNGNRGLTAPGNAQIQNAKSKSKNWRTTLSNNDQKGGKATMISYQMAPQPNSRNHSDPTTKNVDPTPNKHLDGKTVADVLIDLVKTQDTSQLTSDTANEPEKRAPQYLKEAHPYNPENIGWIRTTGQKVAYERYPDFQQKPQSTADYVNLLNDFKNHDGKLIHSGLFYRLWKDEATIGRKPANKRKNLYG